MNYFTIDGIVKNQPEFFHIKDVTGHETAVLSFILLDTGQPYQKSEKLQIECHFSKEVALNIKPYMVIGKNVVVYGKLKQKSFTNSKGNKCIKHYIEADFLKFIDNKKEA